MSLTQPQLPLFTRVSPFLRRLANSCIAAAGLVLLASGVAYAQGSVPLVTVATDQSSLNLSNHFGVPAGTAINQAGDFAFVGNGGSALFLRAAGTPSAARLLQIGDQAPGFPGSQIFSFMPELGINSSSSRSLFFAVRFTDGDNLLHSALLTYDGANYHTVVTSDDIAPGSNGASYGIDLVPGSINDSGDVNFAAVLTGIDGMITYYISPSGALPAVRVVGLNDTPPSACTWCSTSSSSLENFFGGVPTTTHLFVGNLTNVPKLNSKGQMLLSLWGGLFIGGKDGSLSLVPMAATGVCSPQPITTGTFSVGSPGVSAFLNNNGAVAFTNPPYSRSAAVCVAMPAMQGSSPPPTPAVTAGDVAPTGVGGGTMTSPVAQGFDDSGDIVFQSPISGSTVTTFALLRYHLSNGQADVVAYNCEPAPNTNGASFSFPSPIPWSPSSGCGGTIFVGANLSSPFAGVSMASDASVSFNAYLSTGGNAIYRQKTGAAAPEFISLDNNGNFPVSGTNGAIIISSIYSTGGQTEILNNGSVFFASHLTSGTADFAEYLGTPGNVQTLMSTADTLASGARTILGSSPPQAAGHFVAFTALPAGGRINLLESDLASGVITRVTSENDPTLTAAGGPSGLPLLAPNFFLNDSGQVAFETVSANPTSGILRGVIGFTSPSNNTWVDSNSICGTIYLWSPSGGSKKVASAGDPVPNSSAKFPCVALNSGPPSPLNRSGQLAFSSPSPYAGFGACFLCDTGLALPAGVNGDFLYSVEGTISEIAAANDILPGETQATTFVPNLSVPLNSSGQVAFGAQVGPISQAFYVGNGPATRKVMATGDSVPGTSDTFGFPHYLAGLSESGNLAFTAATGIAADGLFFAPAGAAIQTLAIEGGAAPVPGGGTFSLLPTLPIAPNLPPGVFIGGFSSFKNFAAINSESDVAFATAITGGSTNSGYFRRLQSGPAAGTLQAVVLQGHLAPGGGNFNAISTVNSLGGYFALGPDGSLAFLNLIGSASGTKLGMFVALPDGTLLKVAATGDVLPGGGVLTGLSISPKLSAGDAGTFAFEAGIFGGSSRRAIFVTAIPPGSASATITLNQLQSPAVAQQPITLSATVTSANSASPSGTVTFFANGISLGAGTLNLAGQAMLATSSLIAGQNSIVAQYAGDSNFAPGNSSTLQVVVAGFATPPAQLTVTRGQSLVIPMTLFAPSGSNMSFTLICSRLPANTACSFDTNPVAPMQSGTTVHLTLTTMAGSKLPPVIPRNDFPSLQGFELSALLAALFAAAALVWRQAPRWRLVPCACLATFALALAIGGCGAVGSNSNAPSVTGTPAGAATFTLTGTSGATTISTVVNVTVQ